MDALKVKREPMAGWWERPGKAKTDWLEIPTGKGEKGSTAVGNLLLEKDSSNSKTWES